VEQFTVHEGVGIPLRRSDVDTDQIVPSRFLKRISRTGFEDALFAGWRQDPAFVLNQEPYRAGSIMVAGPNFGIGSSREHAVWALRDYGIRAVLAPRFGDIFRGNAGMQGLVAGQISQEDTEALWAVLEGEPGSQLTVDLVERLVRAPGLHPIAFQIDDHTRDALMRGLDAIDLTLADEADIVAFEARRPAHRPRTLPARHEAPAPVRPARSS